MRLDKFDIVLGTIVLVLSIGLIWVCIFLANSLEEISQEYEAKEKSYASRVGESVIVGNDTLLIVDYSLINKSFSLSNGTKINVSFVLNDSISSE